MPRPIQIALLFIACLFAWALSMYLLKSSLWRTLPRMMGERTRQRHAGWAVKEVKTNP